MQYDSHVPKLHYPQKSYHKRQIRTLLLPRIKCPSNRNLQCSNPLTFKDLSLKSIKGIPILFIPGNSGSYKQVRSIASESARFFNKPAYFFDFEDYEAPERRVNNLFIAPLISRKCTQLTFLPKNLRMSLIFL
jgi:hypothetical protein